MRRFFQASLVVILMALVAAHGAAIPADNTTTSTAATATSALDAANSANAYRQAGAEKVMTDDYVGAVVIFNQWVEAQPKNAEAWFLLGFAKAGTQDYAGAIADLDQSLELDPTNAKAYYTRALAKILSVNTDRAGGTKDYAGAIADLNKSLELNHAYADAYYLRGRVKAGTGDVDGARADYSHALELRHDIEFADRIRAALANLQRVVFRDATINGQSANLVLDTDGGSTILSAAGAKRLGVEVGPVESDVTMHWFDKNVPLALSQPVRVTLGQQAFTAQIPVGSETGIECDGAIGWPEVRDNILVFEPTTRMVSAVAQLPAETAGWLKLPVRTDRLLALETPLPDGKTGAIEVDTGDTGGVILAPARWEEWRAAHPGAKIADKISLGALTLTDVPVDEETQTELSGDYAGRLGLAALQRMDLVVDAKEGFAYVKPLPSAGVTNSEAQRSGGNNSADSSDSNRVWTVADSVQVAGQYLLLMSAKLKLALQDYDGAVADAAQAFKLYPKDAEALERLEDASLARGTERLDEHKDIDEAIADFNQVLDLDPKNAEARLAHATAMLNKGQYDNAVIDATYVIGVDAKNADAYFLRGSVEMQMGHYDEAAADLNRTEALNAGNAQAYMELAFIKENQGDHEGAIAELNRTISLNPQNVQAYTMRGGSRLKNDNLNGAITDCNRALELDPQSAAASGAYAIRGIARQLQGNITGALTDYDKDIELTPTHSAPESLYRQLLLAQLGQPSGDLTMNMANWKSDWDKDLGEFLIGNMIEKDLLAVAAEGDARGVSIRLCTAEYFIGEMRLLRGDTVGARDAFQKSLATGERGDPDFKFARAELARLESTSAK
jgi:tetratricopeptide (TPR) repeat protein